MRSIKSPVDTAALIESLQKTAELLFSHYGSFYRQRVHAESIFDRSFRAWNQGLRNRYISSDVEASYRELVLYWFILQKINSAEGHEISTEVSQDFIEELAAYTTLAPDNLSSRDLREAIAGSETGPDHRTVLEQPLSNIFRALRARALTLSFRGGALKDLHANGIRAFVGLSSLEEDLKARILGAYRGGELTLTKGSADVRRELKKIETVVANPTSRFSAYAKLQRIYRDTALIERNKNELFGLPGSVSFRSGLSRAILTGTADSGELEAIVVRLRAYERSESQLNPGLISYLDELKALAQILTSRHPLLHQRLKVFSRQLSNHTSASMAMRELSVKLDRHLERAMLASAPLLHYERAIAEILEYSNSLTSGDEYFTSMTEFCEELETELLLATALA